MPNLRHCTMPRSMLLTEDCLEDYLCLASGAVRFWRCW